ncbi:MAG: DNA mismatch repair protein MutS [Myxococcales bacterium]|nr:DNA mismatch repair protein MutS [Myxococcales bacterium]
MGRRDPSQTPLMQQFREIKSRYPQAIVFFRLGDFYEMFYDDAVEASRLLDLTLTTRDKGRDDAVPMCGVPHHAASGYIAKLTAQGRSVVVCEQVEDPAQAKGLVRRDAVRIVTPGITTDDAVLDPAVACYVAAVAPVGDGFGFAYLDVSTGAFFATQVSSEAELISELVRIAPREVVGPLESKAHGRAALWQRLRTRWSVAWTSVPTHQSPDQELGALATLTSPLSPGIAQAAAMVLAYARSTQLCGDLPVTQLQLVDRKTDVGLDETAVRTLELFETMLARRKEGSLLAVIDRTVTAGGGRVLRHWLARPTADLGELAQRHDAVAWLVTHQATTASAREALAEVYDIERIVTRVCLQQGSAPELVRLRRTLHAAAALTDLLTAHAESPPALLSPGGAAASALMPPALAALGDTLARALQEQAPRQLRDGGTIAAGYDAEVDELRALCTGGSTRLDALEASERARTGIGNLKIGRSRVFGFFIEVSKSQLGKVPSDFVRRQTVAGGERYVTPALAELEDKLQRAEGKLLAREQALFAELTTAVVAVQQPLMMLARWLASVDVLAGFAELARRGRYVRPQLADDARLEIRDGRHPVVEVSPAATAGQFVANDCVLGLASSSDDEAARFLLITGPNMAGKSTYMRQVALIVLLAQIGSFVPASSAHIGVVDRIFTRIGAADDLSRGESTFMVEMRETAAILHGVTERSLVLLDEIGRGTSTYDGLAIAWAVAERLAHRARARTLFATHYHELGQLAAQGAGVRNVSMAVGEQRGELVFLRKVVSGEAARSYGIDVAGRAGVPADVLKRAKAVLARLEATVAGSAGRGSHAQLGLELGPATASSPADRRDVDHGAPTTSAVLVELAGILTDEMTPVQSIAKLHELAGRSRAEVAPRNERRGSSILPFS